MKIKKITHIKNQYLISFLFFKNIYSQRLIIYFLFFYSSGFFAQEIKSFTVNDRMIVREEFDKEVNKMLKETHIPGLSIAIIDKGRIVFSNGYGYKEKKNNEPIDHNTIFESCSMSKSFLVYAVNKLVDQHELDLDKPLYEYLSHPLLENDPRYKLITARMVLGHASGIENWKRNHDPDVLEILAAPGTEFYYSGEGYQYLAKVVEYLLNESYEDYIERMIIKPLNMKRTFVKFNAEGTFPTNYAIGHQIFGDEVKKFKNVIPIPASSINLTAADYAKLIISTFDEHQFSRGRIEDMMKPVIQEYIDNPSLFYGPGFEILKTDKDVLLIHGGDNWGFKGFVCYSIKRKSGLVFFANSDRGKSITKRLCEMTVGFNIEAYFKNDYKSQYPSTTIELLNKYVQEGEEQMLKRMANENDKNIGEKVRNELGRLFIFNNNTLARKLLDDNIKLYPKSAFAYYLLGNLDMIENDYAAAYENLVMAKKLNYTNDPVDPDIEFCRGKLK